ncbi:hypothetical protein [Blautia hansenii]|uniref:hypothetical protein n=1 Tax=Blautia hansenii TaxID=1322 RepID=UPI00205633EF|nr:hypothetical protein [Blautia hansenii]DAH69026.1 MAG TPA: hypothetical protein [Caudoviricetes sp.]
MNKDIFYCYSPVLKKELCSIGERYIAKSTHDKTGKTYWMFMFNEPLKEYLDGRKKIQK